MSIRNTPSYTIPVEGKISTCNSNVLEPTPHKRKAHQFVPETIILKLNTYCNGPIHCFELMIFILKTVQDLKLNLPSPICKLKVPQKHAGFYLNFSYLIFMLSLRLCN